MQHPHLGDDHARGTLSLSLSRGIVLRRRSVARIREEDEETVSLITQLLRDSSTNRPLLLPPLSPVCVVMLGSQKKISSARQRES